MKVLLYISPATLITLFASFQLSPATAPEIRQNLEHFRVIFGIFLRIIRVRSELCNFYKKRCTSESRVGLRHSEKEIRNFFL